MSAFCTSESGADRGTLVRNALTMRHPAAGNLPWGGGDPRGRPVFYETAAQATVEMAVVLPVLLVLALIVYNLLLFAAAAVRFDRVAADVAIAQGISPSGEDEGTSGVAAAVERELAAAMEGYPVEIAVSCEEGGDAADTVLALVGALRTFQCTMRFTPWPSGLSIVGVHLGAPTVLEHERTVTVDPWRPGVVM